MKLRLGAAVLLAAITPLTVVTTSAPAHAGGTDITPPEVGSCHDLTYAEAYEPYDPAPAVSCEERHTTVTSKVIVFDDAPDWSDLDALNTRVSPICGRSLLAYFDGEAKKLQLSTYSSWIFYPTRVQQEAGATWVRCDIGLYGYKSIKPLPTDGAAELGRLPLNDQVAKCRKGKADGYNVTSCDKSHRFHATEAFKYAGDRYPGAKKLAKWTIDKCSRSLRSAFYYEPPSKFQWRVGLRYSVCLKPSRG